MQPTWPDLDHVLEQYAQFQGKLGAAGRPCPDLDGDPWSVIAEMDRLMTGDLSELATRLRLDEVPPAFSELRVSYRTGLAFLLDCRNDQPANASAAAVAVSVLTDDPGFVLPGAAPGSAGSHHRPPRNGPMP